MRFKVKGLKVVLLVFLMSGCATAQEKYVARHPDLSTDQVQALLGKTLTHGLSKDAVLVSLGKPEKTHGYKKDGQLMEVWVYSQFEWHPYESVLFQDGKVVGWNFPKSVKRELDAASPQDLLTAPAEAEAVK